MPRLTEQEQQEIIRFIEADRPLPDKVRFLLFADKRERISAVLVNSEFHDLFAGYPIMRRQSSGIIAL